MSHFPDTWWEMSKPSTVWCCQEPGNNIMSKLINELWYINACKLAQVGILYLGWQTWQETWPENDNATLVFC